MALKGTKGPDRVLYAVSALLQSKLPSMIAQYNAREPAEALLVLPNDSLVLAEGTALTFTIDSVAQSISFAAGTYTSADVITTINDAETALSASAFGSGIILSAAKSIKFTSAFCNLRAGQIVNYQPLIMPNSFIISGVLPAETDIKAYPSVVVELQSIQPADDTIMVTYSVGLTIGLTSPINSSQADFLSKQLLKYYDVIRDILTIEDDGSLGGVTNGCNIISAQIDEATGASNFLKYLTITLDVYLEED